MCICQMQNSCLITSNFLENMDSSTPASETTENVCLFFLVHHLFPLEHVFRYSIFLMQQEIKPQTKNIYQS